MHDNLVDYTQAFEVMNFQNFENYFKYPSNYFDIDCNYNFDSLIN